MVYALVTLAGILVGLITMFLIMRYSRRDIDKIDVEKTFSAMSREALRQNSQDFLTLARETLATQTQTGVSELANNKKLIDQTLESIKSDLQKVEKAVATFDNKRDTSFTAINEQLKNTAEQTSKLQVTTGKLQEALASTKARGQWGERMAEDILRLAGFVENVNYVKQKVQEGVNTRPDYTFFLPRDMKVNMDVKFPRDNYDKFLNEEDETKKESYKQQFLKDTRQRIKEVKTRDYINPKENTVDYVLVFIPIEQIYCFINESDNTLIDEAMKNKVILCSPLTLYAILAVVRQAMDNFNLSKNTSKIQDLLMEFYNQWNKFTEIMDSLGKKIEATQVEYRKLSTTRSDKLEKPLWQIDELRKQQGISAMIQVENNTLNVTPEDEVRD
jgi:DNA recombination protein RmuC